MFKSILKLEASMGYMRFYLKGGARGGGKITKQLNMLITKPDSLRKEKCDSTVRHQRKPEQKCLLDRKGPCTHELRAAGDVCTRPAQDQAGQQSSMEWGDGVHKPFPLTEELWTADDFEGRESRFS